MNAHADRVHRLPRAVPLPTGLASVLPLELFHLFDADELQSLVCGSSDVNVAFLKSVTEYDGVSPTDPHILMFWCVVLLPLGDRVAGVGVCFAGTAAPCCLPTPPLS
jgi:hypothetical protein